MTDYWEILLKAEDDSDMTIKNANEESVRIIDSKRKEADEEIKKLKENYTQNIQQSKQESDAIVQSLQDELQDSQQKGKERVAKQVLDKKDLIVDLLLNAVLSVPNE